MIAERTTLALAPASAVMLCELAEAWIRTQADAGIAFDKMTLLNRVSTYQETARRHLVALAGMQPKNAGARDVTELLGGDGKDNNQK